MSGQCAWCGKTTLDAVVVALIEQGSGPGGTAHACGKCRARYRIIPVDQWTDVGDGRPQYYPAEAISP